MHGGLPDVEDEDEPADAEANADDEDDDHDEDDEPAAPMRRTGATRRSPVTRATGSRRPDTVQPGEGVTHMAQLTRQSGPLDRLKAEASDLAGALAERAVSSAHERLTGTTERLTEYAEGGGGAGLTAALTGAKDFAEGKSPTRSLLGAGMSGLKEKRPGPNEASPRWSSRSSSCCGSSWSGRPSAASRTAPSPTSRPSGSGTR